MLHRFAAMAAVFAMPYACLASEPVVLTTLDGSYRIEGVLLSFQDGYYRVETEAGGLTIDAGDVKCEGPGCPDATALVVEATVGGPTDMIHRLMPPLLESFAEREGLSYRRIFTGDDSVTWELEDPATGLLIARIEGRVKEEDEAMARVASRDADLSLGRADGGGKVNQDVIALDALVPVVSVENPRAMITLGQFRRLLTGSIGTWAELDGPDVPVSLHFVEGRDVTRTLARVFPGVRVRGGTRYADAEEATVAVEGDAAALGLVPLSRIGNTVPLVIGGSCGLSTPPAPANVKAEDYPLTQPLFLHRSGARQPKIIREFIGYVRSHEAQPIIRAAGFVDQAIGFISFDRQGDRLAYAVLTAGDDGQRMAEVQRMVGALMEGQRLTMTFRFRDGSSELDPQSASNVTRLSGAIGRGEFDGKELVFVGFTDGEGPADGNLRLSKRRARAVRRAVAAFASGSQVLLSADGFGEIMPMACDDTGWGRQINRRVEVWLRERRGQAER